MKKALKIAGVTLCLVAIAFFAITPTYLDKSNNKVTRKGPFEKKQSYDSIPFSADLHCDELLWDRDFLQETNYGHIDLPRMQQANIWLCRFLPL